VRAAKLSWPCGGGSGSDGTGGSGGGGGAASVYSSNGGGSGGGGGGRGVDVGALSHTSAVTAAVVVSDGRNGDVVVTGGDDRAIKIWRLSDKAYANADSGGSVGGSVCMFSSKTHRASVRALAVVYMPSVSLPSSPSSSPPTSLMPLVPFVVSASLDQTLCLWDVRSVVDATTTTATTRFKQGRLKRSGAVRTFRASSVTADRSNAFYAATLLTMSSTSAPVSLLGHSNAVTCVAALSPLRVDRSRHMHTQRRSTSATSTPTATVVSASAAPLFASGDADGRVCVWDARFGEAPTHALSPFVDKRTEVTCIAATMTSTLLVPTVNGGDGGDDALSFAASFFNPNGSENSANTNADAVVVDRMCVIAASYKSVIVFVATGDVDGAANKRFGKRSDDYNDNNTNNCNVTDESPASAVPSLAQVASLLGHRGWVTALKTHNIYVPASASQSLASSSPSSLSSSSSSSPLSQHYAAHQPFRAVSPSSPLAHTFTRIFTACDDGCVRVYDLRRAAAVGAGSARGRPIATLTGHKGAVLCIDVTSDGLLLISGGVDKTVRVWDAVTMRQLRVCRGHAAAVTCVRFANSIDAVVVGGGMLSGSCGSSDGSDGGASSDSVLGAADFYSTDRKGNVAVWR
jgi:WD40 repeat protein